jgi:ribonuclease HI
VAEFPADWNRPDEHVFSEGFHETTINRMELCACIRALEYVADQGKSIGVQRVQIITDSIYVANGYKSAPHWRANGWKTLAGRPIENFDLWKKFLSVQGRWKVRTDIIWRKGKKTPILKAVDRAAKAAGKVPSKIDRGFRSGKVGRSNVAGGSSSLYPAMGQEQTIRIYRSALIRKTEHKIYFDVYDDDSRTFREKCTAYVPPLLIGELHRGYCCRVQFGFDPRYPMLTAIVGDLECDALKDKSCT